MKKLTAQEMHRLSPEAFHEAEKVPLTVVLDNVRSLHNIGAVFRTADAFLIEHIILCGCCATPPNQEMHKTALGAELTVKWSYQKETLPVVEQLRQQGYQVYAVEQVEGSVSLNDFIPQGPTAVVLGHEVFGVNQQVVDACNGAIEIPQFGTKHSLNVSVAAGIVLYDISSKLNNRMV